MKQFFKRQTLLNTIIQFTIVFVLLCCTSFGLSSITRPKYWSEAETISRYMSGGNVSHVLMTSRSDSYPNFVNSARNYLGYEIIRAYANNQESFVCSSPDEKITPVVIKNAKLSPHFICLNGYGGNKESFVTRYGNLLFGNDIKSADLGIDKIYITRTLADKLLKTMSLNNGDYQQLMKTGVTVMLSKNKVYIEKKLEIVDIVTSYKQKWMNLIYGEDLIFGGFYCAERAVVDNLMIHSIFENDIYSNAYFFSKAKPLLSERCSYLCEYSVIQNGILVSNEKLNNMIKASNTNDRVAEIVFGVFFIMLLVLIIVIAVLMKKIIIRFIILSNKSFLTVSLSFCLAVVFCSKVNLISFNRFSVFSPFSFIFMFLLYIFFIILVLSFLLNKRKKTIEKKYYTLSI